MKNFVKITVSLCLLLTATWFIKNLVPSTKENQIFGMNLDSEPEKRKETNFRNLASQVKGNKENKKTNNKTSKLNKQVLQNFKTGKDKVNDLRQVYSKSSSITKKLGTKEFRLKGQKLFISTTHSAIPRKEYSGSRSVSSINNHVIVKGKKGLPVIQDPIKLRKGIATGHIIVKARANTDLTALAKEFNLEVHHTIPHLNLIAFVPRQVDQLLDTSVKLSESPLLESVKLDISYGGPREK